MASYLIVGGGMTAHAAARGVREVDAKGTITILSDEAHAPYARPPLSKALWKGEPEEKVWLGDLPGVTVKTRTRALRIDRAARKVRDSAGADHAYDALLLATGGAPRRLPFGGDDVIYFRTLDDYRRLRKTSGRAVVIGGGFIGTEVAASLRTDGREVSLVVPESGLCARAFPADLSEFVTGYYRERGVEVLTGDGVKNVSGGIVTTTSGRALRAGAIVAGLGITPNVQLARDAGLEVGDGIVVDASLRTSDPRIFAAGDVAQVRGRRRVEHEDAANTMGAAAGRAMAGAAVTYDHVPMFYSDLFDLGYEAVGELDARLHTELAWKTPYREGVVYYLRDGNVAGVLLWNTWGRVDEARALLGTHERLK